MQLTGDRFTSETAVFGNDLATLPGLPGRDTRPRRIAPGRVRLPGPLRRPRHPHAGRPAERSRRDESRPRSKVNIGDLAKGGTLIVNTDAFNDRNLQKAGYESNPLEDGSLGDFHVHPVALSSMTVEALKGIEGVTSREAERSKNFFALGLMSWLYHRPVEGTHRIHRGEVREAARDRRGEHEGVQGGLELRRDVRGLRQSRTRSRPRSSSRGRTGRSREIRRSRTASSPRASSQGFRCSSAHIRSLLRPTSSSSSRS